MKAFILKYALTSGITEEEVEYVGGTTQMIGWKKDGWSNAAHYEGKQWVRTHEEAVRAASIMRLKKIQSLKKSIAKLEKMNF